MLQTIEVRAGGRTEVYPGVPEEAPGLWLDAGQYSVQVTGMKGNAQVAEAHGLDDVVLTAGSPTTVHAYLVPTGSVAITDSGTPSAPSSGATIDSVDADFIELALDKSDYPRVVYYDATARDVRVAIWTGFRWDIRTIDETGDVGSYCDIAIDGTGDLHLSYHDATRRKLKHAWSSNGVWTVELVRSPTKDPGLFSSLGVDSTGKVFISYYDAESKTLHVATKSAGQWQDQTVDSNPGAGTWSQLEIGPDDSPIVVYRRVDPDPTAFPERERTPIWMGRLAAQNWALSPVYVCRQCYFSARLGEFLSMTLDSNRNPVIAFYNDGPDVACPSCANTAEPALMEFTGSSWVLTGHGAIEEWDYNPTGDYTKAAVRASDRAAYVLYRGRSSLMLATRDQGLWTRAVLDADAHDYSALAIGRDNALQIVYTAGGRLVYRRNATP